ncbi:hypothetical protein VYJ29_004363 [Yersinia enterocolitica]|nr:hypothetical protein [Yersinia enterocolitica]ELI7926774.1 hypothetical protein [Yersinia enterocolitica]ELI7959252.1 hypothetical protein [Yersinia enterocolitica]ELI8139308.1 hypothetical protein [Yersinia enterocolitica]ELI8180126.1 hypothetical protein [Yersinia enterocolitica]
MSEIKQYDTEVRLEAVMGTNHYGVHIHAMTTEDLHSKSGIAVELAWRDLRIEQLIAQLESAQKERDVYAKLASDVGDIITLLQNNEWAEHIGKTNVGGLLEYQITRLMNSIADINTKLLAAEAALSAANERLKGEPVPVAYFAAAPDYGWDMFNNKEDAIATCQAEIDAYRECRDDGWDDDVQRACWGIVIQKAEGFDHQGVHTSNSHHTYQTCDYSLRPVVVEGNADAE